jgi:hypothetical protein
MRKEAEALDGNALSQVEKIILGNPTAPEPQPFICFLAVLGGQFAS